MLAGYRAYRWVCTSVYANEVDPNLAPMETILPKIWNPLFCLIDFYCFWPALRCLQSPKEDWATQLCLLMQLSDAVRDKCMITPAGRMAKVMKKRSTLSEKSGNCSSLLVVFARSLSARLCSLQQCFHVCYHAYTDTLSPSPDMYALAYRSSYHVCW